VLHELGAGASLSATDGTGTTPALLAVRSGHEGCLRVLHELGAGASLSAADQDGVTPTHWATLEEGHNGCLRVLHELSAGAEEPTLCDPSQLDLKVKQTWLAWRLENVVRDTDATQLSLVSNRANILEGLCAQLGIDEYSGNLVAGAGAALPFAVNVQFEGEVGTGDGLRREWFRQTVAEMLHPSKGLFCSKDGGRTLQPNPHSEIAGGADHLSYFALLGRITGLALYHRVPLDAQWSSAFIKAVLGFDICLEDLESVDPELYDKRIVYLRDSVYASRDGMALEDLGLTFVDDSNDAAYTQGRGLGSVELKPGGAGVDVTEETKAEYLKLFVEHRLLACIKPQVDAVRTGLDVFVDEALRVKLRKWCTVADIQLLVCGVVTLDLDDWRGATQYVDCDATSPTVQWFWSVVTQMDPAQRASLLFFCTGSSRVPAGGFASLSKFQLYLVSQVQTVFPHT
jgi:E3 ubiquitin-protein ligase HACE1